jgi:hypothetical protein
MDGEVFAKKREDPLLNLSPLNKYSLPFFCTPPIILCMNSLHYHFVGKGLRWDFFARIQKIIIILNAFSRGGRFA